MKVGRECSVARLKQSVWAGGWMVLGACLSATPSPVQAQEDLQRTTVEGRYNPEYNAVPIRIGPFDVLPRVEADLEYNDNIYATESDEIGDVIVSVTPSIIARDRRADREYYLRLLAGVDKYLDYSSEDREQFLAIARARFGLGTITRTNIGLELNRNNEQRRDIDSFNSTARPITFTSIRANADVERDFGPITGTLGGNYRSVSYGGDVTLDGIVYDLGFRDFDIYEGRARLAYSRSGDQEVYVQLTANKRSYNVRPDDPSFAPIVTLDRSSRGGRLEVGYRRQVTELLYLDARVGYLVQNYEDPTLPTIKGLAFDGRLLWNVTPLTSVDVTAIRRVDETINPLLSGMLRTEIAAQVDHELRRNVILSVEARYAHLNPLGDAGKVNEYEVAGIARYLLSREWSLTARAEHFERHGIFEQNRVIVGLQYNF